MLPIASCILVLLVATLLNPLDQQLVLPICCTWFGEINSTDHPNVQSMLRIIQMCSCWIRFFRHDASTFGCRVAATIMSMPELLFRLTLLLCKSFPLTLDDTYPSLIQTTSLVRSLLIFPEFHMFLTLFRQEYSHRYTIKIWKVFIDFFCYRHPG